MRIQKELNFAWEQSVTVPGECGTTIYSAVKNDRNWIGCDVAILAIKLIREILTGDDFRLVEGVHFDVRGIPRQPQYGPR